MTNQTWEQLAPQYQDMIYRVAWSCLRDPQDAQDVTQDVLLKLLETEQSFHDAEHLKAWLIRVTVNRCREFLRAPWRKRKAQLLDIEPATVSSEKLPEQMTVLEAVGRLAPKYRLAVHLYYYEQYDTEAIASLTKQSPSAVRQQLSRARKLLKDMLKEAFEQ